MLETYILVGYFTWILNHLYEPSYVLIASFRETKTKKNSEPISTSHPFYDVMVELFYMLKTHE
jgi:hypothetical protein